MRHLVFAICMVLPGLCIGKNIVVCSSCSVKSLTAGIAIAKPGDTIRLQKGVYKEGNIILEKSLAILGEDNPILDGEDKFEILTIHGCDISIQGIAFRNTGIASISDLAGIKIIESHRVRIYNNTFEDTFFGIHISNSTNIFIENNTLISSTQSEHQIGNGIHLWKCEQITINNNYVKGHRDGIYFEFVTHSLVTNNHSEGNMRYGLHFMFSHSDEYRNNKFINNGAGVAVMYTRDVKMTHNTFEHNWGASAYGLLLKDIRDSEVSNNQFTKNTVGIYMEGSSRINFKKNIFSKNGWAVKLQASCDDNFFSKNNFSGNTFDIATNGSLVLNSLQGNYWDKYEGYDLNQDGIGDVPHRPVNMYTLIVERMPASMLLWRSFLVTLLDRAEKVIPAITPENLKDDQPKLRPYDIR